MGDRKIEVSTPVGKGIDLADKVLDKGTEVAKTFSNKEQGSRRLEVDMLSDSKLSKNIRPIIAIWSMALLTIMLVCSGLFKFEFPAEVKETIFWLSIIVMGFYFPGRTAEKWFKTRTPK